MKAELFDLGSPEQVFETSFHLAYLDTGEKHETQNWELYH